MTEFQGMPGDRLGMAVRLLRESAKGPMPSPIHPASSRDDGHSKHARKRPLVHAIVNHPRKGRQAISGLCKSAVVRVPDDICSGEAIVAARESAIKLPPVAASEVIEGEARPAKRESAMFITLPFDDAMLCGIVSTRRTWQSARNRLYLHALSLCRSACDGDKAEAVKLYKATATGEDIRLQNLIGPMIEDIARWDSRIAPLEKQIAPLILASPIGQYVTETKGLGALSVATLIGMTGSLDQFTTIAKLWRFCGLGVSDDGKGRENLIIAGAADRRPIRAAVFVISAGIIKAGNVELRAIYDREKAKALGKEWSKARAHNHAMRYLGKFIIRRMWKIWRGFPLSQEAV